MAIAVEPSRDMRKAHPPGLAEVCYQYSDCDPERALWVALKLIWSGRITADSKGIHGFRFNFGKDK